MMTLNQRIGKRIADLMRMRGLKQVDLVDENTKKAHISHIINGRAGISLPALASICSKLDVSLSEFFEPFSDRSAIIPSYIQELSAFYNDLTYEDVQTLIVMAKRMKAIRQEASASHPPLADQKTSSEEPDAVYYPVHVQGEAAAGAPIFSEAFPDEWVNLPAKYADPERYRTIRARGDSMEPKIHTGDIVVTEIGVMPYDGQMALVFLNGLADDEYTIKRVYHRDGQIVLRSYNKAYNDMIYAPEEIRSCERVLDVFPRAVK